MHVGNFDKKIGECLFCQKQTGIFDKGTPHTENKIKKPSLCERALNFFLLLVIGTAVAFTFHVPVEMIGITAQLPVEFAARAGMVAFFIHGFSII